LRSTPSRCATAVFDPPPAQASTIRERNANACAGATSPPEFDARPATASTAPSLGLGTATPQYARELLTQDTLN
jgi:hypothetical protein